jgi:hypothetical protein
MLVCLLEVFDLLNHALNIAERRTYLIIGFDLSHTFVFKGLCVFVLKLSNLLLQLLEVSMPMFQFKNFILQGDNQLILVISPL